MLKKRRLRWVLVVVVIIWLVWKMLSNAAQMEPARGAELLMNRPWIERLPENPREFLHAAAFFEERSQKFGGFSYSSAYQLRVDFVDFRIAGTRLDVIYLQSGKSARYEARTWRCPDEAPEGLDLCLTLEGGGHLLKLYSAEEWGRGGGPEAVQVRLPAR